MKRLLIWIWLVATGVLVAWWAGFCSPFDRLVLLNTLALGGMVSLLAVPGGMLLGRCAAGTNWLGHLTLLLMLGTAFVPVVFHVSCWDAALGRLGWFTTLLTNRNSVIVAGWLATVWVHTVAIVPQLAIGFWAVFVFGGREREDQALLDASRTQVFWSVTLRRLTPVMIVGAIWCVVNCSREIAVTDIYQVGTLAEQVYLGFSLGQFDPFLGSWNSGDRAIAAGLGVGVQVCVLAWLIASAMLFFFWAVGDDELVSAQRSTRTTKAGYLLSAANLVALLVVVGIPLMNLVVRASFYVKRIDGQSQPGYSFGQSVDAVARAATSYFPQMSWSAGIATTVALITLPAAAWLAWQSRHRVVLRIGIVVLCAFCFAVPGPMLGSGLAWLMSRPGEWMDFLFNRTLFAPVLAQLVVCFPVAVTICVLVFSATGKDAEDQMQTDGSGGFSVFLRLGVAANLRALIGTGLLCFVVAWGELSASQMVLPPGVETVPRLALGLMHAGVNEMTAALTIVNIAGIMLLSLVAWKLVGVRIRLQSSRNRQQFE